MSYTDKINTAQDAKAAAKAMQAGLEHYGAILNALVNATSWDDMAILLAAMQLTAQAMRPFIGESGCAVVDGLLKTTRTMTIPVPKQEDANED